MSDDEELVRIQDDVFTERYVPEETIMMNNE